jgi:hypothetical protein
MNNYDMLIVAILIFIMLFSLIIIYNKPNIIIINIAIVIIILFNVYYWFYYRKIVLNNCEKFNIDEPTTIAPCGLNDNCIYTAKSLEKSGNSSLQYHTNFYNNTIANDYSGFTDVRKGDALLAFNCLKISPDSLNTMINSNGKYGYKYSKIYNTNDNTLTTHIESELKEIIENIKKTDPSAIKLKGPVYAFISQSPYLRYKGNIINARFDTTNNKYSYYNEIVEDNKIVSSFDKNKALYTEIILVFPLYKTITNSDKSLSYIFVSNNNINDFINEIKNNVESNYDLCFLKCNNSFNLTCGCLNSTPEMNKDVTGSSSGPEGANGYTAKCSTEKNEPMDYSMMYFLNPYNPVFNKLILNHLQ